MVLRLRTVGNRYRKFTGGVLDTNSYLVEAPEGWILFDAPQDVCKWLDGSGIKPALLLLTHGHFDHVSDAAEVKARYGARVGIHSADRMMITDVDFFRRVGFALSVAPVEPDIEVNEGADQTFCGMPFDVWHIPGHSPGSVCYHDKTSGVLVGGDVLFSGGIGRWDLPGGDGEGLVRGIKTKLWPMDPATSVLPGHGPATTIGEEKRSNPYAR